MFDRIKNFFKKEDPVAEEAEGYADYTPEVYNLASALSYLEEIDAAMLPQQRQKKLARMKRKIFDSLSYYSDLLPTDEEQEKKEISQ